MTRLTDLPGEVTHLLTVIVAALDIPLPSIEDSDEAARHAVLDERAAGVRIALSVLLGHPCSGDLEDTARYIRERTAEYPVTYTPFSDRRTGEDA
ncbi:hypothetical protein ACIRQY_31015 [Streptomyces sp. NPDC101490]|uniref:hypothetical protein n=1 Tax=Streptomyces sp. NPDC101490 TaxID=3366143 RepID=UPI0037F9F5CE